MADKKTVTAMNNEVRAMFFGDLMALANEGGMETIQTDVTAFDVPLLREDEKFVYATVKVTVHKDDYDVEAKVAEYADVVAQREKRAAELAAKKAKDAEAKAKREAEKTAKANKATGMSLSPAYDKGE